MDDLISRQAAIDLIENDKIDGDSPFIGLPRAQVVNRTCDRHVECLKNLPSAQPEQCEFCKNRGLEDGDTLYISADWDGGIGFDFIRDIHYCPKCGRRL